MEPHWASPVKAKLNRLFQEFVENVYPAIIIFSIPYLFPSSLSFTSDAS
jgi:hypothetical protein